MKSTKTLKALDKLTKTVRGHSFSIEKALRKAEKTDKQMTKLEQGKTKILPNDVTVQDVCNRYSLSLGGMATRMGVSISMLSKIKNGESPITSYVQGKFKNAFPYNLTLVGGKEKWKEKYLSQVEKTKALEAEIESLQAKLELYQKRFEKINILSSSPVENSVSVRVFDQGGD